MTKPHNTVTNLPVHTCEDDFQNFLSRRSLRDKSNADLELLRLAYFDAWEPSADGVVREAASALYGARGVLGSIGNIQNAIDLCDAFLKSNKRQR